MLDIYNSFHERRNLLIRWLPCLQSCRFRYQVNTLRPRQKGDHLQDNSFSCIFVDGNVWITITILQHPKGPGRPRQNGRHFPADVFKCIFLTENVWIPVKMSLNFVPKDPITYIAALVLIMAWRRPGDRLLSEQMMVSLPTHICVTRPQWVNHIQALAQIVAWRGQATSHCLDQWSLVYLRVYA